MELIQKFIKRRKELQMTQAELGAAIGQSDKRISDYESLRRIPTRETVVQICRVLGLDVVPETPRLPTPAQHLCPPRVYRRPGKRSTQEAIWSLFGKAPELAWLKKFLSPQVKALLNEYPADSGWEAAVHLFLVAAKAEFVRVRPQEEGFYQHVVLHPFDEMPAGHLQFPAFSLEWRGRLLMFIPQVKVKAEGYNFDLDFLVGLRRRRQPHWVNVEIDGEGHDSSGDPFRTRCVNMPTLRYRPPHIRSKDFLEVVLNAILESEPMTIAA